MSPASAATPGNIYDRVAAVVPAEGYDPNAAMQFFESTIGWVQPLASMSAPEGGVWTAPGEEDAEAVIIVDWFYREAGYGNDLSLYTVDDNNGKIGALSPGDAGYAAAAANRVEGTLDSLDCASITNPNHQYDVPAASPLIVELEAGTKFAFFLTQGSYENVTPKNYKWFPFSTANVDNYQHFQEVTTGDSGADWYNQWNQNLYAYKVEDLSNDTENYPNPWPTTPPIENDADFNDVVFTVEANLPPVFDATEEGDWYSLDDEIPPGEPLFTLGQELGELYAEDPDGDDVVYSCESSTYFSTSSGGVVSVANPEGLAQYFTSADSISLAVYASDGIVQVASQFVLKKGIIDQTEIRITTVGEESYSPTTADELIADLNTIRNNEDMVEELIIKGHGGPEGIEVGDEDDWLVIVNGNVWIADEDRTALLNDVTDGDTEIDLRGCHTAELAEDVEDALDGADVSGRRWFIIGIPGTPWSIGW